MSLLSRLFGMGTKPDTNGQAGYGMIPGDPLLTGHIPNRYFRHLRCPDGHEVQWQRVGSTVVHDLSFIKRRGASDPMGQFPPKQKYVNIDIYTVACECGKHRIENVFVDMYHVGFDTCIDAVGWTFVRAYPDGRTLRAGEVTSRRS